MGKTHSKWRFSASRITWSSVLRMCRTPEESVLHLFIRLIHLDVVLDKREVNATLRATDPGKSPLSNRNWFILPLARSCLFSKLRIFSLLIEGNATKYLRACASAGSFMAKTEVFLGVL